ncbi:MAG TPA: hypothetical protein VKB88_21685 [Bryobacteraceae bacterium]|nr:hypothetical protein [Bryobacteraceae bacterium]
MKTQTRTQKRRLTFITTAALVLVGSFQPKPVLAASGTLCGAGCDAPALASEVFPPTPFPPQVQFISNGKYTGTLQTHGMTMPITGTLDYLSGATQYTKLQVSFDNPGGKEITRDSWVIITPADITECDIVSTDPTTCRKEVLSGDSYPQCTGWSVTPRGVWISECTVTALGDQATFDFSAVLSTDNKLVQLKENITIGGMTDSIAITMTEQGTTPPLPSDFNRPSICSTGENTIPLNLLLWLL